MIPAIPRFLRHPLSLVCAASLFLCGSRLRAEPAGAAEPAALETEFVYEAVVEIGATVDVGETPAGHRRYIPILGGRFNGKQIHGEVLPGGADWQTERRDGVTELDAVYSMKCDDGTVIIVRNRGVLADQGRYLRTSPQFSVPEGPHAWLNRQQFVGSVTGGPKPGTVLVRVFRVL